MNNHTDKATYTGTVSERGDSMADDTDDITSEDDDFQTNPGDINPMWAMKRDEALPGDYDTPFSPPQGVQDRIDDTHPTTDSRIEPEDRYDEGIEGASGGDLPGEAADEDPQILPDTDDDELPWAA